MDMKDKEQKIHPLVKVGSALSIAALAVGQAGCNPQFQTPELTPTNFPSTLTIEPPVGFEPSTPTPDVISTPIVGVETPTPTESVLPAFRAPTLEELIVPVGEGGPLPEYAQLYYNIMESAKSDVALKVGVDPSKVRTHYKDNLGSKDPSRWMLYYQVDGGGVIWPLKPDGALGDYPAYFEGEAQPDGTLRNTRIDSDYNNWVVAGENAAAIFGGTLPVIVDSPVSVDINGETKSIYSRWIRPGGQPAAYAKDFSEWQKTPDVSAPTPEWADNLPKGFTAVRNKDGTWSIGYLPQGEKEPIIIPSALPDQTGIKLEISGEPFIVTADTQVVYNAESGIARFYDTKGDLTAEYNKGEEKLVDIRLLHDSCYYGRDEIKSFAKISRMTTEINGQTYNTILGIDTEGREKILAAEMTTYTGEKVWTRISVTDLGNNNGKMIIWINPDQDGAIQVNNKTAEMFRSRFFQVVRDGGQGAAISGMTDGKLTIETPYAYYETGGSDVKWETTTLDMHNIEIRILESQEEWQEFAHNYPDIAAKVFSNSFGRSGNGVYFSPKSDGGTLVVVLDTFWSGNFGPYFTKERDWRLDWNNVEGLKSALDESVWATFWEPLTVFSYRSEGKDAFAIATSGVGFARYPFGTTRGALDTLTKGFLDTHPHIK